MLKTVTEAMNTKRLVGVGATPLRHVLDHHGRKLFTNFADFKAYYRDSLLALRHRCGASHSSLRRRLTEFAGDNIGLSHGISREYDTFANGETRVMTSRWTATLYNDQGTWKMLNVHIGADLFDNPVLEALRSWLYKVGVGALLVGGILGFLIARLTGP